MKKATLLALGLGLALVAALAVPSSAQDGPSITVEPSSVEAAGSVEFTVTGAGWTAAPPIFVLPCDAPESGDAADVDSDTCDTANLTPATPTDGAFEVKVTFDVPEGGLAIAAGDAGQTEAAAAVITVGAAPEATATPEATPEATATPEAGSEDGSEDDALANTGVESGLVAIIALAILGAGAMAVGYTRRFI